MSIASGVSPFVEYRGNTLTLESASLFAHLPQVAVDIGIVHVQNVVDGFGVFGLISGIAPDYRTGGIVGRSEIVALLEIGAVLTFITDAPEENRGVSLKRLYHFGQLTDILSRKFRIALRGSGGIVFLSVGIDKASGGLTLHIYAVAVAELNEILGGGIVGGADEVHVGLLEKQGVDAVGSAVGRAATKRVHIVSAGATELHLAAIDKHPVFANLDRAETYLLADCSQRSAVGGNKLDRGGVEVGVLGIPFHRTAYPIAE